MQIAIVLYPGLTAPDATGPTRSCGSCPAPYDAGHPSKASKQVVGRANALGRRIALNPSEVRATAAVAAVAWRRAVGGFRRRRALS
jgi:hypothetical protein